MTCPVSGSAIGSPLQDPLRVQAAIAPARIQDLKCTQ